MIVHLRRVAIVLLSIATASLLPRIASGLGIEEATIAELHASYVSGEHTTRQVVAAYLARIEAYDKQGPYRGVAPAASTAPGVTFITPLP